MITILNMLKKLLLAILNMPIYWLACIIPKNPKIWVFTCRQGMAYAENSKYLFEYICQNNNKFDIQPIWLTKNNDVFELLKKRNLPVAMAYSFKGYWYSLRCQCLFTSNFRRVEADYNDFAISPKTIKFQLWHGSPMKKIGRKITNPGGTTATKLIRKVVSFIFPFYYYRTGCHFMLANSDVTKTTFIEAFNLMPENVLLNGYPKNDRWLKSMDNGRISIKSKIIYLPTWRRDDLQLFSAYNFNISKLEFELKKNNLILDIKLHHYSLEQVSEMFPEIKNSDYINLVHENDVYEVLGNYDILLTDYSSVLFDFLLSRRPVMFAPFDYDHYVLEDVGFLFDYYRDLTPGPIINDWSELISQANALLNQDEFSSKRQVLCNKFNYMKGSSSSEALIKQILTLVSDQKNIPNIAVH